MRNKTHPTHLIQDLLVPRESLDNKKPTESTPNTTKHVVFFSTDII